MIPLDSISAFFEGITSAWKKAIAAYILLAFSVSLTLCSVEGFEGDIGKALPLLLFTWPLTLFVFCFTWAYFIPIPFFALVVILFQCFNVMREGFDKKSVYVLLTFPAFIILLPALAHFFLSRSQPGAGFWWCYGEFLGLVIFSIIYWQSGRYEEE